MRKHLYANLWLLGSTLALCCVAYVVALWVLGQVFFPRTAAGSLLAGPGGRPVGSGLIAQPFSGDEHFHPRPSAVAYNASASGGSNWGASQYLLRDRVARQLGPIARYRTAPAQGRSVQRDLEQWFEATPDVVATWADRYPGSARAWVNADDRHKAAVVDWKAQHPAALSEWKASHPGAGDPEPADLAVPFFRGNSASFHRSWPRLIEDPSWGVTAVFFEMWLQDHEGVDLEPVPADLVTTSGSGLDPHITLEGARYQRERVADAWSRKTNIEKAVVLREIENLLVEKARAPLYGWAGVPLINVLEVNLSIADRLNGPVRPATRR
ncbi:MAG: potassium-transporting ATPase subunit C [Isosphaeraceae bacterium]|nr:potassium-transporting ATPase subunit C [Isosphaeraceae bacterium]